MPGTLLANTQLYPGQPSGASAVGPYDTCDGTTRVFFWGRMNDEACTLYGSNGAWSLRFTLR